MHGRWEAFRGESKEEKDLLFTTKIARRLLVALVVVILNYISAYARGKDYGDAVTTIFDTFIN
jgi:hypothetical protein